MKHVVGFERVGKGRYRATFDNGIACLLYRGEASCLSIEKGVAISEEQYEKLMTEVLEKRAKKRAMYLLEQMDRSEKKLREKLVAGEYPQRCIDEAISYVKKYGYLDDSRFASTYIRYHQEKLGRVQIYQKLISKGISRDDIQSALDQEYTADEMEHIERLLEKKHYDSKTCDEREFRRIYQFLQRRGFKNSQIIKAMKQE